MKCIVVSLSNAFGQLHHHHLVLDWLSYSDVLEQQQYFHTHSHTHARTGPCPFNHDCPSFRLEPYI